MPLLEKTYDPKQVEERLYKSWEENGLFHDEPDPEKKPYSIVMPPPNITGQLHMGHALDNTMQDTLIRWRRMQGYCTLWLPGTDHASIATEVKVMEKLQEEKGVTKHDIGREAFLERAWAWKEQYGGIIVKQLKKLGGSCDWQRERFTMDEGCSKAVSDVFINLYNKGLIYKGEKIINWCVGCKTALSDAEVEYEEQASHLWHIKYPVADDSGEYIVVATTRPETMLADTAVAVNNTDERYAAMVGKQLILPLTGRTIPVIADEYVEKDFGSGAVKITPAHDPNDFEVGLRHGLEMPRCINDDGTMNEMAGKYCGMDRMECRKELVKDLQEQGYLVEIENYSHNVGCCYRCHTTVEPILSKQWFVSMKPLAKPAIEVIKDKRVQFVPERFEKTYLNWMENIRDWCISRQLWWGHRIPAYYCDCGETVVAKENPGKCPKCGGALKQDEDVLDTWFSSALWPFSTLGWPEKTKDLEYFYPTNTLVTAYDIIFFWVARMIFSGLEHMDKEPFKHVLIHGIIRDAEGRKMSKSLGNGIDPLEVINKYGADALRFALTVGVAPGNDMRYKEEKTEAARNFANKLWNASRFVLMNLESGNIVEYTDSDLDVADKWILNRLDAVINEVTDNLEKFELGIAAQKIYDFIWGDYCDWYIELAKIRLNSDRQSDKDVAVSVLVDVLNAAIRLLHPIMPFITEEIYQHLPNVSSSIMRSQWPTASGKDYSLDAADMDSVMQVITAIRNRRAEMNVPPSKRTSLFIEAKKIDSFLKCAKYIERLAYVNEVNELPTGYDVTNTVSVVTGEAEIYIPLNELIDPEKEMKRLSEELNRLIGEIARAEGKLNNAGFVDKAPQKVVDAEREKLQKYRDMKEKVELQLARLGQGQN